MRRAIRAQQPSDGLAATHRRRGPLSRPRAPRLARILQSMLIGLKATLSASTSPRRPCKGMLATSASQCRTAWRCTLWQSINPNGETWRITQAQITTYIKTAITLAHAAGGSVMLAGDWNAVQQASDRQPSAHLNPMDNIFMDRPGCDGPAVSNCLAGRLPSREGFPQRAACRHTNGTANRARKHPQELTTFFVPAGVGGQPLPPPWSSHKC